MLTESRNKQAKIACKKILVSHSSKKYFEYRPVVSEYPISKGAKIPLQALKGQEDTKRLRLPDFKTVSILRW
jgi:hypothetical protein